jgi:RNA polymerase sigma-70 factor (ECF subfamily)
MTEKDGSSGGGPPERTPADDAAALRARLRERVVRYCPRWMRDQVDDIVQVAWLRLEKTPRGDEADPTFGSSYLARVAYCVTVDEIRRRRRRREVPVDGAEHTLRTAAVDPARAMKAREIGDAIEACLARLLTGRRRAVALYLQGHTISQTGTLLGWARKRADNMVFRGLADLRRCLARKGFTP